MSVHLHRITTILSAGAILFAVSLPASAIDVGVGASVGGQGGLNAGVGASIGGGQGVNAGVGASVGGHGGVNAGGGASVGGGHGVNAGAGASIGGNGGVNAGVGASIGGRQGVNAGVGASIGGGRGVGAGVTASIGGRGGLNGRIGANVGRRVGAKVEIGIGGVPEVPNPGDPNTVVPGPERVGPATPGVTPGTTEQRVVSSLGGEKMLAFKRRCREILGNPASYDGDLVSLCAALRTAAQ